MTSKEFGSTVLFEFETVVDLDLALLKYIQNEYSDSKFFNKHVLMADDYILKSLLLTRTNKNPLSVIIDDAYINNIDNLYGEIIKTKETELFRYSSPLASLTIIHSLNGDSGIDCVINCKNVDEEQFIKQHVSPNITTVVQGYNVDLSRYDAIYIKNVEDSLKYKSINGKSIYFLDYDYNIEPDRKDRMPLFSVSIVISSSNNIYLVSPYINFNTPI